MSHTNQGISLVICCYNSVSRISETLKHIALQEIKTSFPWEIILIDNNSNDNTSNTALKIWQTLNSSVPFQIINEKRQGLSFARETGIHQAKYDFILFCDDDNWLNNDYVEYAFNIMQRDNKIGALGGWGIPVFGGEIPIWFNETNAYGVGKPIKESGKVDKLEQMIYGAGVIIRKKLYVDLKKNGFKFQLTGRKANSVTGGEDTELFFAFLILGYKIYFDKRLIFKHFIPKERLTEDYINRLTFHGIKNSAIISAYYHEYKEYPNNYLFYSIWLTKLIISDKITSIKRDDKNDFISKIKRQNKKESLSYLMQNRIEYKNTRNNIQKWKKNL